jgi:hypothetical protein
MVCTLVQFRPSESQVASAAENFPGGAGASAILLSAFPIFASVAWLRVSAAFQYFSESPNAVLSGSAY